MQGDNLTEQNERFRLVLGAPQASDGRPVLVGDNALAVIVDDDPSNRPPSCAAVAADVASLWPPNHTLVTITLTGATDPDDEAVSLAVTGVTQDEAVNGLGDSDTSPDAVLGPGSNQVQLRAERAGTGDGRVYRLAVTATDPKGATCTAVATVGVPHAKEEPAIDSGGAFNSFAHEQSPEMRSDSGSSLMEQPRDSGSHHEAARGLDGEAPLTVLHALAQWRQDPV